MQTRTEPRRVLVTGAGSGLGRAIAERLARAGDAVIGTVRDPERARRLTEAAAGTGLALRYLPLELSRFEELEAFASGLEAEGGVEVVVHNAGFGVFGPIEEVGAAELERQFTVNVFGPMHLTRLLLPGLRARRGRVVFVGSLAGRIALPFQAHYSASKAALASFSDALRLELEPFGVRVCCVEPGDFATGFTDARQVRRAEGSPYGEKLQACLTAVEEQERGGAGPEWAARVVEEICRQPSPPARRPVGRWARTLCVLLGLLPDAVRERVVRRTYRL
jgi:NAD(P)-dependent dehydrogenase (short-subunit alcohol dehydrogenase family)